MKALALAAALALLAVSGLAVAMRAVPMPADAWHVDPEEVTPPERPNYALLAGADAPVAALPPPEAAEALERAAAEDGAELIAGDLGAGLATYVVRSPLMGFPDAVSVRLDPAGEDGTRISVFARARFGYSDMGVNAKRVRDWLSDLPLSAAAGS